MNTVKRIGTIGGGFYLVWAAMYFMTCAAAVAPGWYWYETLLGVSFITVAFCTGIGMVILGAKPPKRRKTIKVASDNRIRKVTTYR